MFLTCNQMELRLNCSLVTGIKVNTITYDKIGNVLSSSETKYEYDDKPNPFYKLADILLYFSVNNRVKMTMSIVPTGEYIE